MNQKIFKYPMYDNPAGPDIITLELPKEAKVLTVQLQDETEYIWAIVDPEAELEDRKFIWLGTGWPFDFVNAVYIGTIQDPPFVWHLFEVK